MHFMQTLAKNVLGTTTYLGWRLLRAIKKSGDINSKT
jgi:hypothetical protein